MATKETTTTPATRRLAARLTRSFWERLPLPLFALLMAPLLLLLLPLFALLAALAAAMDTEPMD